MGSAADAAAARTAVTRAKGQRQRHEAHAVQQSVVGTEERMGAAPSAPSDAQLAELRETMEESVKRAAAAITQADVLLLLTGAGWSADSGLSVYKDVADIKAYRDRDLTYSSICEPHWLEDDPELFYGFWGKCFNDYRNTTEHEGYHIVKRWRDLMFDHTPTANALATRHGGRAQAFWSFTSNVDAHHLRVFGEEEVRECHGNSETWQCSDCSCHTTSADAPSRWAAPAGFRFAVDSETQNAPNLAPASPPSEVSAQKQGHGFDSNHPRCPRCAKPMRPSILMFADADWCDNRAQQDRWVAWQQAVEKQTTTQHSDAASAPLRIAILEVGAGGNVTTIRQLAENTVDSIRERGGVATLIRVNPDLPLADSSSRQDATISLPNYGLAALKQIDEAMTELRNKDAAAVAAAESNPLLLKTVPVEKDEEKGASAAAVKPGEVAPSTPEQLQKVREKFDAIDTDRSGTLNRDEIQRAALQLGRCFIGNDLDEAMSQMDADGNGEVDYAEFCAWWEGGGKLSASERFDLKWAQFGAKFDAVLSSALSSAGIR